MWRLQTYAGLSFISILAMIYYAFHSRGQFYPAMVFLSTSKISLALFLNMGLLVMCILWQLTRKVFLGSLREAEVERLNEQSWREVIEILFAITIFKQDFSVSFLAMVTALLLIKGLHWLAQKRVEYIETIQTVTVMSHIRIASFMCFLLLTDGLFLYNSLISLLAAQQASVSLFFSFEYMILATTTMTTFIKYIFCVSDLLMEGQWERKSVYIFYLDLIHDLLHLSMYLCFFMLIFINYGVPLHLIRELYETFHNFRVRVADYIRYRKITSNLNERFPDATPEELSMALVWPFESSTTSTNRPFRSQTDVHQQASTSTSQRSSGGSDEVDDTSSNQARIQDAAAAAAVSIYGKSLVYPSPVALVRNPGYAVLAQVNEPFPDSTSNSVDGPCSLGLLKFQQLGFLDRHLMSPRPLSTNWFLVPFQLPSTNVMSNQLETEIKFLEYQIEVLQNQLRCLQEPREDEVAYSTDLVSPDTKGKAIAYS